MSGSVHSILSMPNSTVGAFKLNVSPYLLDVIAVVVLVITWRTDNATVQSLGFVSAVLLAVWAALSAWSLRQYILDIPQSKIGSAAQGFVELQGRCRFYGDRVTQGFTHGPPCVWHRFAIIGMIFPLIKTGESEMPFVISDETGDCVVNASGAKVLSSSRRSWFSQAAYYRIRFIRHGAPVYVIGELRTNGCDKSFYSERMELANVLKTWKQDPAWLLEEFDADNNGKLDFEEWETARKRAGYIAKDKYEVKREDHVETAIRKPSNGMPMLISDKSPAILAHRFQYMASFNMLVAGVCIAALCYGFIA